MEGTVYSPNADERKRIQEISIKFADTIGGLDEKPIIVYAGIIAFKQAYEELNNIAGGKIFSS